MRFGALHQLASYLMLAAAFSPVALSGEVGAPLLLLTFVAGAASALVDPAKAPLLRRRGWTVAWNVGTVLMFLASVGAFVRGDPFLLCGVRFLCFLVVNKLWNRRTSKDWMQAYVVSFLMLVAATTLNTELVYALCFVAYVVFATWTLTLFHLRRELEEVQGQGQGQPGGAEGAERLERVLASRRVVGGRFLAGTSLVSLSIFLGSSVFFFLFPRIGFNVFSAHARRGLTVGFNDRGVELGQNGLIQDNNQVVMRVELPEPPPVPLYFRGISFDQYENGKWSPSHVIRLPLQRWGDLAVVGTRKHMPLDTAALRGQMARSVVQEIYLEPMETSVLFAASQAVALKLPPLRPGAPVPPDVAGGWLDPHASFSTDNLFAPSRTGGIRYTAWSLVDDTDAGRLRAAPEVTEAHADVLDAYLDVDDVPARVVELARKITAGAPGDNARKPGPYARAQAVLGYLHDHYRYTLDLKHDPGKEPIEEFLFDRRAGHCEYFASAMALLLRAVGIPTRHVAGFHGGEWNAVGHYLQVRQRDAHAWVEAYFEGVGWVRFDPTPPIGVGGDPSLGDRLRQLFDVVQLTWFKYVIEYDLATQVDLYSRARKWWASKWRHPSKKQVGASWVSRYKTDLERGAAGLVAIGALVALALRRRIRRSAARRLTRSDRLYARAARALERRGYARVSSETAQALARRVSGAGDPGGAPFTDLVNVYYQARWGGHPVNLERMERLASEVARPEPTKW